MSSSHRARSCAADRTEPAYDPPAATRLQRMPSSLSGATHNWDESDSANLLICRVEVRPGTTGHRVAEPNLGPRHAGWLYGRLSRYYRRSQTAADRRRCRR